MENTEGAEIDLCRFVVLDTESTGFDPRRDRIVSIGAVAVKEGWIDLGDLFELILPIAYNNASVFVHGITRDQSLEGAPEDEALARLREFLGEDAVVVGHHIEHDLALLAHSARRWDLCWPHYRFVDTAELAMRLRRAGEFTGRVMADFSLDGLSRFFDVAAHDRHTASGDALITAQIFVRLLKACRRVGWQDLGALQERYAGES